MFVCTPFVNVLALATNVTVALSFNTSAIGAAIETATEGAV